MSRSFPPPGRVFSFTAPAARTMLAFALLCLLTACGPQPVASPASGPLAATPRATSVSASTETPPGPAAPSVVNESQLLPSGIRIEEHPLVSRPEIEPLVLLSLDGENEVQLLRTHASLLRQSLRPESYYSVSAGSLWVMQGNDKLETMEIGGTDTSAAVTRNGQAFFSVPNNGPGVTSPFRVLANYDDYWVLELAQRVEKPDANVYFSGRVFIDGKPLNDQYGYEESFGFQTMAGKPFYFFRRDGQIGVAVDGQQVSLGYDDVPHYGCCSAGALNPRIARNMIAFFARRGDRWYYVEIGAFDEDR